MMNRSSWDLVAIVTTVLFVCLVLLLAVIIWSIRRHRDPKLHIECDSPIDELIPSLAGLTLSTAVAGNSVEILENGAFFDVLLQRIRSAQKSVHFETFLWKEGVLGQRVADALSEAARAGKQVRVLLDAEGSKEVGKAVPQIPVLFMKPSTSVIGPDESIVYPEDGENIHFEGELTVVIGKKARHVSAADALDHVLGYTCGNDVSDRVLQRRESEFGCLLAGKGYDTFAPMGPVVATGLDPSRLGIVTRVNGAVRQDGTTADLLFSVPAIVSYLSRYMTLLPGDMIMTGTPAGVGPIQVGDSIEVEIEGIGILRNDVVAEDRGSARSR